MSEPRHEKILEIGSAINAAIRAAVKRCEPASKTEIMHGLAAGVSMVVGYESAQVFLDQLAVCIDAKEHVRAIDAGEVPAVN